MVTVTRNAPVNAPAGSPLELPRLTPQSGQASGQAARALAQGYLRYVSAVWRGDQEATTFAARLDRFWSPDLPPVPAAVPAAISPHGGGGHGIWWFETAEEVRGYVPGAGGGYRIPIGAVPGLVRGAPSCSRANQS